MGNLCSDPTCEYCRRIRERGRYKYDAIHKCIDCGAIHAKGLRCRTCCNEHWKMIRKMARRKKPRPRCIDCGKEHTHGLRCGECCQKHSIEEWVRKNPERHDFGAKMRTKLAMRLCTHCEKLFYTHCGKSTKRPIKCPL